MNINNILIQLQIYEILTKILPFRPNDVKLHKKAPARSFRPRTMRLPSQSSFGDAFVGRVFRMASGFELDVTIKLTRMERNRTKVAIWQNIQHAYVR